MSKRLGIIVDGEGDFASFRRRFPNGCKVLKTDGPRGHTASIREIASKARKQILMLVAFKCDKVIVVLDFENRATSYSDFVNNLICEFQNIACTIPVNIAVPNRMIENWYLADIEFLSKHRTFLRDGLKQKTYEGRDGKRELKRLMKKNISYSETKHGPELFEILRFDVARTNSNSFNAFLSYLNDCIIA
jgi:hypothetical protein